MFTTETSLRSRSPITFCWIDAFLKAHDSPLYGIGMAVIAAQAKYNVNATYILAHAIHETGWGRSDICRFKNNLFGWMAFDASPWVSSKQFPTKLECIDYVVGKISAMYLTPGGIYYRGDVLGDYSIGRGMEGVYATDPQWADKIVAICNMIESAYALVKSSE